MRYAVLFIIVPLFLFAQRTIQHRDVKWLYDTPAWKSSVAAVDSLAFQDEYGTSHEYYELTSDTLQNTLTTRKLGGRNAIGGIFITTKVLTDSAQTGAYDTVAVTLQCGLKRGYGFPDSSGFEWKNVKTWTGSDTASFVISDSTWWIDKLTNEYKWRFKENYIQKNKYIIHEFKNEED